MRSRRRSARWGQFAWKNFSLGATMIRRILLAAGLAVLLAATSSLAAQPTYDHGEVTAYGDLFRVAPSGVTATNYLGVGGRVGFNTGQYMTLEAELNYDFEQNYTNITVIGNTGITTSTTYTAGVRPITGLFGPKIEFGSTGRSASSSKPRADLSASAPVATRLPDRQGVLPLPLHRSEDLQRTSQRTPAVVSRRSPERSASASMRATKSGSTTARTTICA